MTYRSPVCAALPPVLDVEGQVPPARGGGSEEGAAEDVTDAEIVSPEQPKEEGSRPRGPGGALATGPGRPGPTQARGSGPGPRHEEVR